MSALRASIVLLGDGHPPTWRSGLLHDGAARLRTTSDFVFEVEVARDRFVGPWD
jgi:hypothetical protein